MKLRLLIALVIMASAAFALPVVYVDPFNATFQDVVCTSFGAPCTDRTTDAEEAAPETYGGYREMFINRPGTSRSVAGTVWPAEEFLEFAQGVGGSSILQVFWSAGVNHEELNWDVTVYNTDTFELMAQSDMGMMASLTINSNGAAGTPYVFAIPATSVWTLIQIPFSAFTGVTFTDVDEIVLTLDGTSQPAADAGVQYLAIGTPEPGSLLLIGGGLLGLSLLRRRMRRA
jgi:hypothetical protein